jgi:hypothetical protein
VCDQETVEKYTQRKYLYVTPEDPDANGLPTATFPPGISTGALERWMYANAASQNGHRLERSYSLGTTSYEDCFTMGGIVAPACHGTGKNFPTLSDWLVAIEFVDATACIRRVTVKGVCQKKSQEWDQWEDWDVVKELNITPHDLFQSAICNLGLFGVMWSLTMKVIEGFDTLFISAAVPWKSYLDNTTTALKNLNDLQNQSDSLEFLHQPLHTKKDGIRWTVNQNVQLFRHLKDTPENREILEKEGFHIERKGLDYFLFRDAKTRAGSIVFSKLITFLLKKKSRIILPYVLAQIPNFLEYTVDPKDPQKKMAISLPHWRANHSVNAVGAVELVRCVNIEWALPITFNEKDGNGFSEALKMHSTLINEIHKEAKKNRFPITLVAEIRFFRGSGAYLAAEYDDQFQYPVDPFENTKGPYHGWAAPSLVTGDCNPWWNKFYQRMNEMLYSTKPPLLRTHLAKEYCILPNQLERLRNSYTFGGKNAFQIFQTVAKALDKNGYFLVPFLDQFLFSDIPEYKGSKDYPIQTDGSLEPIRT